MTQQNEELIKTKVPYLMMVPMEDLKTLNVSKMFALAFDMYASQIDELQHQSEMLMMYADQEGIDFASMNIDGTLMALGFAEEVTSFDGKATEMKYIVPKMPVCFMVHHDEEDEDD